MKPQDQSRDKRAEKKEPALKKKKEEQKIDETIENSFPASDPPSWTSGPSKKKAA